MLTDINSFYPFDSN